MGSEKQEDKLSANERSILLNIARDSIFAAASNQILPPIPLPDLPEILGQPGASFVTLTISGKLRGCIGALEACQPLAQDVREHAAAAATQDYRFAPVSPDEVPLIEIEISRLNPTRELQYSGPEDLVSKIRPGVDGVVIRDGIRRATFLPQVWEKAPTTEEFLDHLCMKMGAAPNLWREKHLEVFVYQVEEFKEDLHHG